MKYFVLSKEDPCFAVYEKDGLWYPVFAEKYGTRPVEPGRDREEVTDPKTIEALEKYRAPYGQGSLNIYMAGPLFNEGDRYTNLLNSDRLRALGYSTFLPQEVVINKDSSLLVKSACFFMDLKAIAECDILLANCNGIDIDSGTAAEIGLAYGWKKKTILYKSDVRNYYNETFRLNNFVMGLTEHPVCETIEQVIAEIGKG